MNDTVKVIIEIPKEIYARCKEYKLWSYDAETLEGAVATSKPLSENKEEWIPVSERLPEKDMLCLVAVGLLNLTQLAMYSDLMGVIDHRIFYQGDVGHDSFEDITEYVEAWIPLPEPYKAESEDK